jgi:hypothetical protein
MIISSMTGALSVSCLHSGAQSSEQATRGAITTSSGVRGTTQTIGMMSVGVGGM